jgi:hypothetical protein
MADEDRPSMKEDDHPDHNMPDSEYDGEVTPPKMSDRPGANNMIANMAYRSSLGAAQRARKAQGTE